MCVYLFCFICVFVIFYLVYDFFVIVFNYVMNMFLFWFRNWKYDFNCFDLCVMYLICGDNVVMFLMMM